MMAKIIVQSYIPQMENITNITSLQKKHQNSFTNQLLMCLPAIYHSHNNNGNQYQQIIHALQSICSNPRPDEDLDELFRELMVDKQNWLKMETYGQRFQHVMAQLEKSIDESKKKVNTQLNNYLSKGYTPCLKENKPKDPFEWLKLKNKYPMCEQKLKAKLVQAISDSKNEVRIRERMANPSQPKVNLLDESLILDEYEKIKISYKWTEEDEAILVRNINSLKHKFNHTQFLKMCERFRFISMHEFETLAAEQISRKLDQDNKVFLSRQFLLDKYYSTKQFLTEQQMRFILKTSPLLSKCVDKQFIRSAIKNIEYEDISKLELKIAEDIIARFDQIRKAVRQSRKNFKHNKNNKIKDQIVQFERKKELEIARQLAREEMSKHKIIRPKSHKSLKYMAENGQSKKVYMPLNKFHPPSGLFVKDCNEQCTDDLFNSYELNYLERDKLLKKYKAPIRNSISMLQFYTGGMDTSIPSLSDESISVICKILKAHHYEKSIKLTLDNYDVNKCTSFSGRTSKSIKSTVHSHKTAYDLDRKTKKAVKNSEECQEAAIKRKIVENKQKAKAVVYVNKLLVLAAENNFTGVKALNAKFTPEQVNTKDYKGNTPLFYATKYMNSEFMTFLLDAGADPSIPCENNFTPLHYIFKTNCLNLITRCLTAPKTPNLNAVNQENRTPLAYCSHQILNILNLQEGVAVVQNKMIGFDNNLLLTSYRAQESSGNGQRGSRADNGMWASD